MDDKLKEIASYFRVDSDYCYDCEYIYEDRQDKCIVCMKRKIDKDGLEAFKEYLIGNFCCVPDIMLCNNIDGADTCRKCWEKWWEE